MDESAVVFATAEWCGSDICCVVFPPSRRFNSILKHVDTIVASGMLLIRQYDPDKHSADEAMEEMQECFDPSTSILRMPSADDPEGEAETEDARRERLKSIESVVIRSVDDELVLICPKGIDDVLPAEFQRDLQQCTALWIAQYDRNESTLRQCLLAIKAGRPEAFTVFTLPGRRRRSRRSRGSRARTSGR